MNAEVNHFQGGVFMVKSVPVAVSEIILVLFVVE